ncbi:cobalt ECF transporter T component CbiQ [Limosilactobacillus sp. STM2_1]|uniref:Cobalt ECF transporter T component CbiQ n=1 Tax=Limosilactobacillus rudii TaxID=2759755 RepID=A0A7W3UL25_9LACO|nr:cobalt ECF transporter T component CbiQ [Limosilactobacillus rudii]MBB1079430.1 cobalt ECF transporter T component CbiQ [Limosilactobacillus rudii]MBB1097476.1 cobalt ECF transporter T component CbiQ [Limosilactobacillus rudii]MCD7134585.1 cobalt ECF transporter T component CbiQ [Limosilactobacillus rudii]
MLSIDKYAYENRIVNWSPKFKALLWLVGIMLAFQPIQWLKVIVLVAVVAITIYLTKVSVKRYFSWFYPIIPFVILSIVGIVVTASVHKTSLIWPVKVGSVYIGMAKVMMPKAGRMVLQCMTAIVCTYWFALTTPFIQILQVLKAARFPRVMIEVTMLMYRFIFIFIDAFEQIRQAQKLRFGYDSLSLMIRSSGILAKMLFEQVIINYEMMTKALDAKLYDGDFYI